MNEALLIVISIGVVFCIILTLTCLHQIHKLKEVYSMTTAEVLAKIDEANAATAEIATDIDTLVEMVANRDDVPQEVADAITSLGTRLTETAAKFTAEAEGGGPE